MSEECRQTGEIQLILTNADMIDVNGYLQELYRYQIEVLPKHCENWLEACNDFLYKNDRNEEYLFVRDKLYLVRKIKEHDTSSSFCKLYKKDDNTYEFITQYYDGGTYLEEMLSDELEKL